MNTLIEPEGDILLVDKPSGLSSFGIVARVKRVLSERADRKIKVGHTGTLDPFATGLMILVTGKKCREAGTFSKLDKWYEADIQLGSTSTTGDPEGVITSISEQQPLRQEIDEVLTRFRGEIVQTPPIYSAIKINGQRAYKLAREGKEIDMPSRTVQVYTLECLAYSYPLLRIRTHVSSGTYVRTLAQDIGEQLAVGAYCTQLRRTKIADYSIEQAITLESLGITS